MKKYILTLLGAASLMLLVTTSARASCAQVTAYQDTNSACVQICSANMCAADGGSITLIHGGACADSPKAPGAILTVTVVDGCSIFDPCKVKPTVRIVVTCPSGVQKTIYATMPAHCSTASWYIIVYCDPVSNDCFAGLCLLHSSCI